MSENNAENEWMSMVKTAFFAVLLAMTIRSVLFEPFNIPSESMKPNFVIGDYLFVSKYTYGYSRYSFPFGIAPIEGRLWESEPKRGDVAVFKLPSDTRINYIKRVIGLPGDTVQVRNGLLYLNDTLVPREKVETDEVDDDVALAQNLQTYKQTLPEGKTFLIHETGDQEALDNTKVFTVPEGHYFMMGDNRDNSLDSRAAVGFVPLENFVGRAEIIFFSTNGSAKLYEFWKWPWTVRYERLLKITE